VSYSTQENFEFMAKAAHFDMSEGLVDRVVLQTDDVEPGQISVKPRVRRQTGEVNGVPKYESDALPRPEDLPENLAEVAEKVANDPKEVPVVATVTVLDRSDEPEMNGDDKVYFISQGNVDSVQLKVVEETQGENEQQVIMDK